MGCDIWDAALGEELLCERELTNSVGLYAVPVMKSCQPVGNIPKKKFTQYLYEEEEL